MGALEIVFSVVVAVTVTVSARTTQPLQTNSHKVVCFYNSNSHLREGQGKFQISDLEIALPYCTHLVYGYAAINDVSRKLIPLNENFDTVQDNYRKVTSLRSRYPNVKFLLSVGGNADISGSGDEKNVKYRELIESSALRIGFINSAINLVKTYGFDGIDLAWEFPETKPKKIRSSIGKIWHTIKVKVAGHSVIDKKAADHRAQIIALVRDLKREFASEHLLVSLTVLPNVNSTVYYDPRALSPHLDFVNLMSYDFYTPERNPEEADFTSPLYDLIDRRFDENVDYQVKYWTLNGAPASKLVLGIPTFGRTWKMTSDSDINGIPPLTVDGPGEQGPHTKDAGLLSYPEICHLTKTENNYYRGAGGVTTPPSPFEQYKKISDSTKRKGSYIYRIADKKQDGIWISYEDLDTAANKAAYARAKGLGGVALSDISLDDFKGTCSADRYPVLRSAKINL